MEAKKSEGSIVIMIFKHKYFILFSVFLVIWIRFMTQTNIVNKYFYDPNEYILVAIRYLHPNDTKTQLKEYTKIFDTFYSENEKISNERSNPHTKSISEIWSKKNLAFFEIKPLLPFLASKITKHFPSLTLIDSFLYLTSIGMALCFVLLFFWIKKESHDRIAFILSFSLLFMFEVFGKISILIFPDSLSALFSLLFLFMIYYSYFPILWGIVFLLAVLARQDNLLLLPLGIFLLLGLMRLENKKISKNQFIGLTGTFLSFAFYLTLGFSIFTFTKYNHLQNLHNYFTPFRDLLFSIPQSSFVYFALPLLFSLPYIKNKHILLVVIAILYSLIKLMIHPLFLERFLLPSYLIVYMISWMAIIERMSQEKTQNHKAGGRL